MNYFSTVCVFVCIVTLEAAEKDVLVLDDKNFDSQLAETERSIVMFYAPWCGHCKRLKPEFEKAAEALRDHEYPMKFFKVDCTEQGKEICNRFQVTGYPTVKLFNHNQFVKEYDGPRQADGIVNNLKSQLGPASKHITTLDERDAFLSKDGLSVIAYIATNDLLKTTFDKVADKLREKIHFAHVTDPSLTDESSKDKIILYRPKILHCKFEDPSLTYKGDAANPSELEKFIKDNQNGLCNVRSATNMETFKEPLVVAYYDVDYKKNPKGTNYWRNRIMKVAKNYADKLSFAISSKDELQSELNEFGFDYVKGDKPVICSKDAKGRKFKLDAEFSPEAFEKFIQDFLADRLEPYIKSEPVPTDNSQPLKVAVAKNFAEVVLEDRDVLVEFYAPWCGHCKKLAPVFEELANKLKDEDVSVVKMDATANDVPPSYSVRGFPTLYWKPKGQSPQPYEGGRELDDFVKFIASHASKELNSWDRNGNLRKSEL